MSVLKEVRQYIKVFDRIEIHQFGFALIYLPFYLALKAACIDKPISFAKSTGDDVDTVINLQRESYRSPSSLSLKYKERVLRLGLSELVSITDRETEHLKNNTHHEPIITRMPLWGVSMEKNPRVQAKVTARHQAAHAVFGSKISRLRIEDLEDDPSLSQDENIQVGTYSSRSTSYRLIKEKLGDKVKAIPEGDAEAFKFLMNYEDRYSGIDVFLSIQPWLMMQYAEDIQQNTRIMLVYNHPSPYKVYSSLYARRLIGPEDKLLGKFIKYLAFLVWEETAQLYNSNPETFDKLIKIYCDLRTTAQQNIDKCIIPEDKVRENVSTNGTCKWCIAPKKSALELICDSRIWHVHPKRDAFLNEVTNNPLSADVFKWEEEKYLSSDVKVTDDNRVDILKEYFPYRWANDIHKIQSDTEEQNKVLTCDPIYFTSKLFIVDPELVKKRHSNEKVEHDKTIIDKLQNIIKFMRPTEENTICKKDTKWSDINNHWKIEPTENEGGYSTVLPRVMKKMREKHEISCKDGAVFFCPAVMSENEYKSLLVDAFDLLDADLEKSKCTLEKVVCARKDSPDIIKFNDDNFRDVLNILCIEYKLENGGRAPGKFVNANKIGHEILNGYWISGTETEAVHYFKRAHGIQLSKSASNGDISLILKWANTEWEHTISGSNEAWIFTFRTLIEK